MDHADDDWESCGVSLHGMVTRGLEAADGVSAAKTLLMKSTDMAVDIVEPLVRVLTFWVRAAVHCLLNWLCYCLCQCPVLSLCRSCYSSRKRERET